MGGAAVMIAAHPPGSGSGSAVRGRTTLAVLRTLFERVDVVALAFDDERAYADPATRFVPRPRRPRTIEQLAMLARGGSYYWDERAARVERALRGLVAGGELLRAYDLLWCSAPLMARAALAVSAGARVLDIDNVPSEDLRLLTASQTAGAGRSAYRDLLWRVLAREERARANLHDAVIVTSSGERRLLGPVRSPVVVLPNTVPPVPAAAVHDATHEVLFVGSLSYGPNIEAVEWLISDIWPRLAPANVVVTLRIVGRNPSAALRQRCRDAAGVELVADAPSLVEYYHAARAVIVPLRSGGGTGRIKILEAMSFGVPIVATTQSVDGVAVAHGRDVLLADDAEGLAGRIAELLVDAPRARLIGRAGHAVWARDHAPEAAAVIVGSVVERVLKLRPR